ncbi:short chain dehydrogenase [Bosea caraganae]|uniref:Short chain dehydrogenase n=1 Tax=Bosea caraganae TaxID=2763117 RepID=A0A370LCR6_9HYPH|nr:short chain dehydrogenase [Bosea caraganae]RDJ27299.1 short chain dehydrogenase [Bosea caraganae]RDJ29315.1 short chain dehydrogenase [Bosea caraganae]
MRIAIIGATGTIGRAVSAALEPGHEVIRLSRSSTPPVDLGQPATLPALFAKKPGLDAVICCAANAPMAPLETQTPDTVLAAVQGKLLGQIELSRLAALHLNDRGSVTLTAGTFAELRPGSAIGAMVNAGLERFVQAAAGDMRRGIRLNLISPGWVAETLMQLGHDGAAGTPAATVATAYVEATGGMANGRVFRPSQPQPEHAVAALRT